ncbi:hypothetical protein K438DRAFT_1785531 [Mycena galopus ATCC 62051]|nr:hypothetical protein K438DRAFT_1785531 [Mycena galopus ATCC 62051]
MPDSDSSDASATGTDDETAWESDWEEGDTEPQPWESLPTPRTYDERMSRNDQKRANAEAKRRATEMRSAEHQLGGAINNQQGLSGKHRGPYGVGGLAPRMIQQKCKKLKDDFESGKLRISATELERQLAAIRAQGSTGTSDAKSKQTSITSMFAKALPKRSRAISVSDDDVLEISPPIDTSSQPPEKRSKPDGSQASSSASSSVPGENKDEAISPADSDIEEEPEISPEELEKEARLEHGDEAVNSIVVADNIPEWIEVLEDAAPLDPASLGALASDSLKLARKNQDYRSTVLFAALVDFYRWMPRMGRLRAALRIAKNHGRGPAFQRVIAAQARFFEANGSLKPSHQGQQKLQKGLLNDEGFYMGLQRWLRTLEVGTVVKHKAFA